MGKGGRGGISGNCSFGTKIKAVDFQLFILFIKKIFNIKYLKYDKEVGRRQKIRMNYKESSHWSMQWHRSISKTLSPVREARHRSLLTVHFHI